MMKQSHYKWLKAGIICSVTGAVLIFAGYLNDGCSYVAHADLNRLEWGARSDVPARVSTLPRTDLGALDSVDISFTDLDLEILPSKDEHCAIAWEVASANGKSPVDYEVKSGALTVTESEHTGDSYIHIDISFLADLFCGKKAEHPADTVYLYVPTEKFRQVSIHNTMGDVSVDGLQAAHGSLSLSDGDAMCTNCQFFDFSFQNTLGELTISDSMLDTCDITMSDDDLTLDHNQYQGSITITDKLGDVTIQNSIEALQSLSLQLSTKLGEISLPEALAKTLMENDDDLNSYAQKNNGNATLTIACTDGDIILNE